MFALPSPARGEGAVTSHRARGIDGAPMIANDTLVIRTIQFGLFAALFGAWYIVTRSGAAPLKLFLPAPELVWREMGVLVQSGQLWSALYVTITSIAKAYAIAVVAGIAVGFAVARSRTLVHMFEPVLSGMFAVPLTMFFPLFVLFFGIGPDFEGRLWRDLRVLPDRAQHHRRVLQCRRALSAAPRAPWARRPGSSSAMSTCRRRCR